MQQNAVTLKNVSRWEKGGKEPILKNVSAELPEGRLIALVGADGAGKTTLMRIVAGLLAPQEGDVALFGESLYGPDLYRLQNLCGYMPQQFGLYTDLSVFENLSLYADLFGLEGEVRAERFEQLLKMTDLTRFQERLAGKLSGGMKQKLGLACALLNHPKLLLLDEPSVGVDPFSRRDLWNILKENVKQESMSVLVATTYMDEAALCDEVLILENGELMLMDTPANIAHYAHGLCFRAEVDEDEKVRDVQAEFLDDVDHVLDAVPEAGYVRVLLRTDCDVDAYLSGLDRELKPLQARLEDGYLTKRWENQPKKSYSVIHGSDDQKTQFNDKEPVVRAKDLVRKFGDFVAVDETSFEVYPGEIFGLLGPNGAGKTTTFKMLCGLLTVSAGDLEVAGLDVRKQREKTRERLGYMSQKFALYGDLSVKQNFEFFANAYGLHGQQARDRIAMLAEEFELEDFMDRSARELPGGLKQRLAMAVALLHHPPILFLDEPTSGADVPTRRQFWRWMTALSQMGTTIIVTTHFMEEAQYCDNLLIQDAGKSLILGSPEYVRADSATMDEAFIRIVNESRNAKE